MCILLLLGLAFTPVPAASQSIQLAGLRIIIVKTESEAAELLKRIQAGASFDELARKYSVDRTASSGGYLGIISLNELRPELQSALQTLNKGQVSRVTAIGDEFALVRLLTDEEASAAELKNRSAGAGAASERVWQLAIDSNDAGAIKRLLDSGADSNARFGDGSTVLMGAAQRGQFDVVRMLLESGADVNSHTQDGMTALLAAAQAGQTEIVRMLAAAGADVNARKSDGGTALMDAAFGGRTEIVRVLLESGADPNLTLRDGSTALMAAAGKGRNDVLKALLERGARVNAGIDTGGTALMEAAYAGEAGAVRILLDAGADVKAANGDGVTALMGAALGGHTEAVRVLLDAGASADPHDKRNWTALKYARASANPATVRLVLDKTTNITAAERSIALGGTYMNEYYSSNDSSLIEMAAAEFQKALAAQPQDVEALEWMGAVEFLLWDKSAPTMEQFRRAEALLQKSAELDPNDPDRHCWIAAVAAIFASKTKIASADLADILNEGIQHAKKALELDPQFADAMDHLTLLYRLKGESAAADAAHQNAVQTRRRLGNRPSRFNDQFSRPALPPPLN